MVDARLTQDRVRLERFARRGRGHRRRGRAGTSSRRDCASSSPAFAAPTSRGPTTPRPSSPTRSGSCPISSEGDVGAGRERRGEVPRHPAAGPVLRGDVDQEARGPRYRSTLDLRLGDEDDRAPRLRVEEGQVTRADLSRLRGRQPARSTTSPTSWTTSSRRPWRTSWTRSPRAARTSSRGCSEFYFGDESATGELARLGLRAHDPRAPRVRLRGNQLPRPRRRARRSARLRCARAATVPTSCTARTGSRSPRRPSPIRSASSKRPRAARGAEQRPRTRARRRRRDDLSQGRSLRSLRPGRAR